MADMLRRALAKWNELPESERWLAGELPAEGAKGRPETHYPADGLALRQTVRDLPRSFVPNDRWAKAWNKDFLWYRKAEVRAMLPAKFSVGETVEVPRALVLRLATCNLMDTVRGQSSRWSEQDIQEMRLSAKILAVKGSEVEVRFDGLAKANRVGRWPIAGNRDSAAPTDQKRGYDLVLGGTAKFDSAKGRFIEFSLVAAGTRWGATQYNGRNEDQGPAPIGFLFEIASEAPHDRVPPSEFGAYGWR